MIMVAIRMIAIIINDTLDRLKGVITKLSNLTQNY